MKKTPDPIVVVGEALKKKNQYSIVKEQPTLRIHFPDSQDAPGLTISWAPLPFPSPRVNDLPGPWLQKGHWQICAFPLSSSSLRLQIIDSKGIYPPF